MSYQVIARKWRPQTFDEVTGQEPVTRTLRNSIAHGRLHHAYLFSGARGVGKTTTARLLAKAVNCHRADGPTPEPCRADDAAACVSCREIAEGRSIDVLEIDAASNTQVEKTREVIINNIGIAPARDRYKVFIIDEVHMLSTSSFNALLKTLEEPPPRVLFIMATTEQHRLPDTILSRCQQFEFRTIAAAKIGERLRLIADAEGVPVSDEALREIARAGEGSMRDAQSAFDQVISFSGALFDAPSGVSGEEAQGEAKTIGVEDVETALGIAGAEMLGRVVRAIAEERPAEMLAVVDDLVMRGQDLRNFCRDLLAHLRDLLVFKVAGDSTAFSDAGATERRALSEGGRDFSESDLVRFFHSLTDTERQLRESVHPRYQLEIGLVKLVEMRRLAPLSKIVERLNALEESLRTGKFPTVEPGAPNSPAQGSGGPSSRGGAADKGGATAASRGDAATARAESGAVMQSGATDEQPVTHEQPVTRAVQGDTRPHAASSAEQSQASVGHLPAQSPQPEAGGARPAFGGAQALAHAPTHAAQAHTLQAPTRNGPGTAFGAGRAAVSGHTNLTLVASPPNVAATEVAAAPFSLVTDEAPFSLGDEAPRVLNETPRVLSEAPRVLNEAPHALKSETAPAPYVAPGAGEDRADEPVALHSPYAPESGSGVESAAGEPYGAESTARSPSMGGLIRRKLEARKKPLLAIAVDAARRVRVEGEEVCVEFPPESKQLREMLNKPEALKLLREVCGEIVGRDVSVRTEIREASADDAAMLTPEEEERLERQRLRERAEKNQELRHVLKTFRAEIIEVQLVEERQAPAS